MDYEQLANAITEKTKVIVPVDIAGVPCDYDRIFDIVERKKALFHPSNDVQRAIGKRFKRIFKQAERDAKQDNDDKEEYDSAIMDAIIDASEDKRSRKQRVKEMREVLNEDK